MFRIVLSQKNYWKPILVGHKNASQTFEHVCWKFSFELLQKKKALQKTSRDMFRRAILSPYILYMYTCICNSLVSFIHWPWKNKQHKTRFVYFSGKSFRLIPTCIYVSTWSTRLKYSWPKSHKMWSPFSERTH